MSEDQETVVVHGYGAALFGIDAIRVEVQATRKQGLPQSTVLGKAGTEVKEGRDRLRVALRAQGLWDAKGEPAVIVNLAPANLPKAGTGLDLPICLAFLATRKEALRAPLLRSLAFAEVGLNGRLRSVPGTLSVALMARDEGFERILVAPESAREAAEVRGLEVLAVADLASAVDVLCGRTSAQAPWPPAPPDSAGVFDVDLSDVKGQHTARHALEVAAAGGHNLLMVGPPGSGKTLLARRLPTILPPPEHDEAIEITRIHSAAGLVAPGQGLIRSRPFRAPHHTVSGPGLIGGGSSPRPGEVSLASGGVLFLDEFPEFSRGVLEMLRQPLEDRVVAIVRVSGRVVFPSRFMLVAAMNPCPCGWRDSVVRTCTCSPGLVERYRQRLSGPLLDRIDIHVTVAAIPPEDLSSRRGGEDSATVRARVIAARERQSRRNRRFGVTVNAALGGRALDAVCRLDRVARRCLDDGIRKKGLSARAHDRILKVARTLADLAGAEHVGLDHISEAIAYRELDRERPAAFS